MTADINKKREQVADQYKVVARLAEALAVVHREIEPDIRDGRMTRLLDMMGERSARIMETLGDILNGMDAVCDEDAWMDPIFEAAHEMFPVSAEDAP